MKEVYLSVVIPSYNETENLKRGVLAEVRDYLKKQSYVWEVIVSDDGSPDKESQKLAKDFCDKNDGFIFLANEHAGKPFAVWSGIQKASGKYVLYTDMDQSTPISEIRKLLPCFDEGYDIVIGSRGVEREKSALLRRLASLIFREFRRSLLLTEIIDTQAGFKVFRREVALEIFPLLQVLRTPREKTIGWKVTSFDVELLVAAQERGYKISEEAIKWENRDKSMSSKQSISTTKFMKESMDMFKEVWRVKFNQLRGFYRK